VLKCVPYGAIRKPLITIDLRTEEPRQNQFAMGRNRLQCIFYYLTQLLCAKVFYVSTVIVRQSIIVWYVRAEGWQWTV